MTAAGYICKGSYAIGSACGKCVRCTEDFLDMSSKGWVQDGPHRMVPPGKVPNCAVPIKPSPPAVKTCRDCRHCDQHGTRDQWLCLRPTGEVDLVSGEDEGLRVPCIFERNEAPEPYACGPVGRFWEPKP